MFVNLPFFAVAGLALLKGVRSQTTTAALFPDVTDGVDGLQGQIEGTGADGTTYIISGTFSGAPFTETLVEDATHLSENAEPSISGGFIEMCNYDAQHNGTCTVVFNHDSDGIHTVETQVFSASVSLAPVSLEATSSSPEVTSLPAVTFSPAATSSPAANSSPAILRVAAISVAVPIISLVLIL